MEDYGYGVQKFMQAARELYAEDPFNNIMDKTFELQKSLEKTHTSFNYYTYLNKIRPNSVQMSKRHNLPCNVLKLILAHFVR